MFRSSFGETFWDSSKSFIENHWISDGFPERSSKRIPERIAGGIPPVPWDPSWITFRILSEDPSRIPTKSFCWDFTKSFFCFFISSWVPSKLFQRFLLGVSLTFLQKFFFFFKEYFWGSFPLWDFFRSFFPSAITPAVTYEYPNEFILRLLQKFLLCVLQEFLQIAFQEFIWDTFGESSRSYFLVCLRISQKFLKFFFNYFRICSGAHSELSTCFFKRFLKKFFRGFIQDLFCDFSRRSERMPRRISEENTSRKFPEIHGTISEKKEEIP